jgi:hypothetical protein
MTNRQESDEILSPNGMPQQFSPSFPSKSNFHHLTHHIHHSSASPPSSPRFTFGKADESIKVRKYDKSYPCVQFSAAPSSSSSFYSSHHNSSSAVTGLWMLVDGIGLAIITTATILEGYELWKEVFQVNWDFNSGSLMLWLIGRSSQILGLLLLIGTCFFFVLLLSLIFGSHFFTFDLMLFLSFFASLFL